MSLFGGDSGGSLSPGNNYSDSSAIDSDSGEAQNAQPVSRLTLDDDDDEDSNSYEEEEGVEQDDEDGQTARPNRFAGKASTWRSLTAADRRVAVALDQIQSGDLAAHLYNAHALKRRVRLPVNELAAVQDRQIKDSWLKKDQELRFTDVLGEAQTELVPTKRWTAWPLPPSGMPTSGGGFGRRESDFERDGYMCRIPDTQYHGDELREEMLAVILRFAKENWLCREKADEHEGRDTTAQNKSRAHAENDDSDAVMQDAGETSSHTESAVQSGSEKKWAPIRNPGKRAGKAMSASARPAFLADDDAAKTILLPSVNALLSRLEGLATTVRRARFNHHGEGAGTDTSESELASDVDSVLAKSRSESRSRERSDPKRPSLSRTPSRGPSKRARKASRKAGDSDLNESDDGDTKNASRQSSLEKGKQQSSRRNSSPHTDPNAPVRSLMDWSEVLGLASTIGWDEKVISRSAQRCASLFGETMLFRPLDVGQAKNREPRTVHYTPQSVHGMNRLEVQDDAAAKRPFFQVGTLRCPHVDCPRHKIDSPTAYRVVEHVMRTHGYDPRTNDSDNEERTEGGVHKDGFLLPITAKLGWMGHGRSKSVEGKQLRKRGKKKQEEVDTSPIPD
jgi:N-terminal acetyltransferase B complex catalytic subunit